MVDVHVTVMFLARLFSKKTRGIVIALSSCRVVVVSRRPKTLTLAITFAILKIATWYLACMCISWSCTFWVVKGQGHPSRSKVKKLFFFWFFMCISSTCTFWVVKRSRSMMTFKVKGKKNKIQAPIKWIISGLLWVKVDHKWIALNKSGLKVDYFE